MKQDVLRTLQASLRNMLNRIRRRKGQSPWLIAGLVLVIIVLSYLLEEPKAPAGLTKGEEMLCTIKSIYDGDTLTVRCPGGDVKVRVFGIDAPEMGQKPWGEQSGLAMRRLLAESGPVRLHVKDQDRYGRVVAEVWVHARNVGLELVRQGHAIIYEQYNNDAGYRQAQSEARKARRGIWEYPGSQQDPAAWRRLNPR